MSKLSIDKHAPVANNSQNPYDFNGVSVSTNLLLIQTFFKSQNHHPAVTNVAQLVLEDNLLVLLSKDWEPR